MPLRSVPGSKAANSRAGIGPVFALAEAAFVRHDLATCSLLLGSCEPTTVAERARAALLRAKVARIRGDDDLWFAAARESVRDDVPAEVRLSGLALWALAARRCKGDREASALFERLAAECSRARPADAAYARYISALDAWERRDYGEAERLANENIASAIDQFESIALLGWISVKRERFVRAGTFFRKALSIVRRMDPIPIHQYGVFVQCVLNMALETADLAVCTRMSEEYKKVPWTESSALVRFTVLGRLRYAALLEGDLKRAWFLGRAEATIFNEGPYAASGECSASVVTRALGDQKVADLQLQRAWEIIRTYGWGNANAEERIVLLDFACVAATHRPSEARKALMIYLSVAEKEDPEESLTRDRRVTATECWAAGRVSEALRKRAEAIVHYRQAFDIFRELGCVMRAADVALDLFRLTRDPLYCEPINALAERAPHAYIVRRAREFEGPLGKLGPVQRTILARILRGEGAKAIAAELGRSPHTVINHTRRIFDAFEVHSRAELRRACAEAKIAAESIF